MANKMKLLSKVINFLASGLLIHSFVVFAATEDANHLLTKMHDAVRNSNYEMTFINANHSGYEVIRYRHAIFDKKVLAQLTYMEGAIREILLQGNKVGYYQHQTQPFSIKSHFIVDGLPAIFQANINQLSHYYNFIIAGQARTANRSSILVRMVDKEHLRYGQMLWLDDKTYLPLRVDYLDNDGEIVEQFKVASLTISDDIINLLKPINEMELPPLIPKPGAEQQEKLKFNWQVKWLPQGFKQLSRSSNELETQGDSVESRLFSDGIYTFTVNVMPINKSVKDQLIIKGARTVYAETRGDFEIIIIGELPLSTAKRIIAGIRFVN